jgi:CheY-like chemotaxis protein
VVDDHASFRRSARAVLEAGGYDVCDVPDGPSAVRAAARCAPDAVLLDVQMPGMDGFATAQALAALPAPPPVVFVSSRSRRDYGRRIDESPVAGFLAKSELTADRLRAVLAKDTS